MQPVNGKGNGAGNGSGSSNGSGRGVGSESARGEPPPPPLSKAPDAIAELSEGCVRFVERAVGVKLDYQPETLPLLDHYIAQARADARARPEILSVLSQTSGAYFGEVVRRRHASWWRTEGSDPADWQIELESVYLAFSPVRLIQEAVLRVGADAEGAGEEARGGFSSLVGSAEEGEEGEAGAGEIAQLELEEEDHAAVAARLAELPPVSEEEFYAPSTRLEVIDIAVEAIRARRMAAGEQADALLRPEDYDRGHH